MLGPAPGRCATELRLATTTSPVDTGLLGALNVPFEQAHDAKVRVIAVGSGEALKLGREGKADVVLVHAPDAEVLFMTQGFGTDRRAVMHNDFVLVGPEDDPAGIRGVHNPSVALARIAAGERPFVSRADASGTYQKERSLWRAAGIVPSGAWYVPEGRGMGETLQTANGRGAYTLTDRGTYLSYAKRIGLTILVEGSPALYNPYHVIVVKPAPGGQVRDELARAYADYLAGPEAQGVIASFRVGGQALFHPEAPPTGTAGR